MALKGPGLLLDDLRAALARLAEVPEDREAAEAVIDLARVFVTVLDRAAAPVLMPADPDPEPEVVTGRRRFQPITADFMATVPLIGLADVEPTGRYTIPGNSFDEPSVGLRVLNPGHIGIQAFDSATSRHPDVQPTLAMTSVSGRALAALLVVMAEESENVHSRHRF